MGKLITAILLAAGESRRMGEFKQLLPFGGKTIVECCVDTLLASAADDVLVVLGHRSNEVRNAIGHRPVRYAVNPDYQDGMSTSIKRGIEAVPLGVNAVLIALSDQPQIRPEVVNQVIEVYQRENALFVVPTYNGRNGHPIIVDLSLRKEILGINPMQGLRQLVHANSARIRRIEIGTEAVVLDIDRPEDYDRISKSLPDL